MSFSIADLPWLPRAPENFRSLCRVLDPAATGIGTAIQGLATHNLSAAEATGLGKAIARGREAGADLAPLSPYRLAILSNATTDFIADALPAAAARHGVAVSVVATPFDQIPQQAMDPNGALHRAHPDGVLLALDHRWLGFDKFDASNDAERQIETAMTRIGEVVEALRRGGVPTILQTVPVPPDALFGGFDRRVAETPRALIEETNRRMIAQAEKHGCYLLDVATLAERVGTDAWFDPVVWHAYKLPFAAAFVPIYADTVGRLLGAIRGKSRKCLVLDLDNTIWGGVIGDDGMDRLVIGMGSSGGEAFLAVQRMALDLRARGIVLAVSSRNDEETAREPFREHPDMLLREEHIAVFQANWLDKASNIEAIAKALNLGLDAMVLLDDNPAERAYVRAALPAVAVPELPSDPSWYGRVLAAAGYFETVGFTAEDRLRADAYAADANRAEVMAKSRDLGDYLASLDMAISLSPFDARSRQRIAQLINKSNQFNLTTRRYTEAEIEALEADAGAYTLQARLRDRFGDLGMISAVICRPEETSGAGWIIDSWLMSCRVLGRQVEMAMLCEIVGAARRGGIPHLIGIYRPTAKNGMVADHFDKLGFVKTGASPDGEIRYRLKLDAFATPALPMRVER